MSDRCEKEVEVTERLDGQTINVFLPCCREHGHKGPCLAEEPREPEEQDTGAPCPTCGSTLLDTGTGWLICPTCKVGSDD